MSLTIKQTVAAHDALSLLIAKDQENKYVFHSSVRIKFALNLREIKAVVEKFYADYNKLVELHGESQPDGTFKVTDAEKLKVFNIERQNLLETDSGIDLGPVNLSDLGNNQISIDLLVVLLDTGLVLDDSKAVKKTAKK